MMVVNSYCLSFSLNVWMRSCYVILLFMLQTSPLHLLGCFMEYSIGENLSLRKWSKWLVLHDCSWAPLVILFVPINQNIFNYFIFQLDLLLQAAIKPPTFVFFVNDGKLFPETYRRYMEKQHRSDAGFFGTPIRLLWRSRRKVGNDESRYL